MTTEDKAVLRTVYQAKLAEQAEQYDGNLSCAYVKMLWFSIVFRDGVIYEAGRGT